MATAELHLDAAETLPADVATALPEIAYAASEAAFGMIASRLASLGYPVTGDFAPSEVASIEEAFALCVRGMAINNADIAALNDPDAPSVWVTQEVYEPSSLRWVEGLTELSMRRDPTSFAGFAATVRGSRAAIREFMQTHWGDGEANEALPNWLTDIRPDAEAKPSNPPDDKYDAAYSRGYNDGLQDRAANYPLDDDANVNYRDGYADGSFKRRADAEDEGA